MPTIPEIRQQYPQYNDLNDAQLASALHSKFYSDMPEETFNAKIGYKPEPLSVDNIVRSMARGVPILGGAMDRIAAAGDAATQPLLGRGSGAENFADRYNANLEAERAKDTSFDQAHPVASTAGEFAGGVGAFGAAARIPAVAGALGITGPSLGGMVTRGALSGAGIGAADAAIRGHNPLVGGGAGAFTGMAGPVIGRAVGGAIESGVNAARNFVRPSENVAGAKVLDAATRDAIDLPAAQAALGEMGPSAMIADLGPNLQRQAGAVAATPGEGQQIVRTAIRERDQAAGQRLGQAADTALGDNQDLMALASEIANRRRNIASPLYERAYAAPFKPSKTIQGLLNTPAGKSAVKYAEKLSENEGVPFQLDVRGLDLVKRSLDDMIELGRRSGSNNEARIISSLRDRIIGEVDKAVPVYAEARKAFASESAVKDALEMGQNIFANKLHPGALRVELSKMDDAAKEALVQGARGAVANAMATARTDAAGALKVLRNGFTREKLNLLIGKDSTDQLYNTVQSELRMQGTKHIVTQNSETAARQAARGDLQDMRPEISPQDAFALGGVRGVVRTQIMQHATNFLNGLRNGDRAAAERSIAQILTATGPERDAALRQVFEAARQSDPSGRLTSQITSLVAGGLRSIQSGVQPSLP